MALSAEHQLFVLREKLSPPSPSSPSTATTLSRSSHLNTLDAANTPATSTNSGFEERSAPKMDKQIPSKMAAENRGRSQAPAPTATEDDEDVPVPSYSWILPSHSISPPARAASPSTASSASSTSDSAASSLALFIKTQVTRLRENPRPILASRLSNLRPMRPEGRISRWMLDVEAQQERDGEVQSLLGGNGNAGERDCGTLYRIADSLRGSHSAKYGQLIRGVQIREDELYQKDAQPSEDECDLENGCACGCWWQWVVLTVVVLALIAWGLWVLLGDPDVGGSKRLL